MYQHDSTDHTNVGALWQPGDPLPPEPEEPDDSPESGARIYNRSTNMERDRLRRQAEQVRARADSFVPDVNGFFDDDVPEPHVQLAIRSASSIAVKTVEWLWRWWIPRGMLTLLAGYGGSGKSTIALHIAACVSSGKPLPDGTIVPIQDVLIFAAEDSAEHTIVPRLIGLDADLHRIHIVDGTRFSSSNEVEWFDATTQAALLEDAINDYNIGFVIIDPIASYAGDTNGDKESDVRRLLMPLVTIADATGAAILLVRHVAKGGVDGRAGGRILGSVAWHDVVRVALMVADAPQHMEQPKNDAGFRDAIRMLGVAKSNIGPKPALYRITHPIDGPLRFNLEQSGLSLEDCYTPVNDRQSNGKEAEAEQYLLAALGDGPVASRQVEDDGASQGISKASLRRAKRNLGVESTKQPGTGTWLWSLPDKVLTPSTPELLSTLSTFHNEAAQDAQDALDIQVENLSIFPDIHPEKDSDVLPPTGTEDGDDWTF